MTASIWQGRLHITATHSENILGNTRELPLVGNADVLLGIPGRLHGLPDERVVEEVCVKAQNR
jgi:hypothetical protein